MSSKYNDAVYSFIKYATIGGLILGFASLAVGSFLVFDDAFIVSHPTKFIIETLIMGIFTSLPIAYLCYNRGTTKYSRIISDSSLFFLKIVLLHVGFHLSGVYSVLFPKVESVLKSP